jgi:DNA primase
LAAVALYTNDSRDRVRDAVDFVELVSARTELRRAGPARYEGLCPFHEERTPSFGIDPTQKVYYCFGCQASGDVFTFVQETEGVDFKGALELLAERYGVELQLEQEDPREAERRRRRERLLELLARTTAYYERYLWESSEAARAREYLAARGLNEEILREFRVGYAPSAWDRVLLASRRGGFSEQELYATGLAQRSRQNGALYDRFRSRIMFPLTDIRGRVLGFGARAMAEEPSPGSAGPAGVARPQVAGAPPAAAAPGRPKYLNTSENDVYHKGLHLYGAHLARAHAARSGQVILCEGYTDTIALHQAGIRNAVGLMGTALTGDQVGELARMAQTALLALDADSAGQEAMLRAFSLANKRKLKLRVVPLPAGTDPADLLQHDGPAAMQALIGEAMPFVRFRVERVLATGDHGSAEGREAMVEDLGPVFAELDPGTTQNELIQLVSERLDLPASLAERLLASSGGGHASGGGRPTGPPSASGARTRPRISEDRAAREPVGRGGVWGRREDTERAFLALCIAFPEEGERAIQSLDVAEHFSSELLRRAATRLREGGLREPMRESVPVSAGTEGASAEGASGELDGDPELRALLAELVVEAGREESNAEMLEVQRLQLALAGMDRQIQRARGKDRGDVSDLAKQRAEVKREFDRVYGRVLEETGDREG